jgi:hypothetical protein
MTVPLDAIRAFHKAFRKDLTAMNAAAYAAVRGEGKIDFVLERYSFFIDMLAWHASGEEDHVFTAMERAAPLVAEAYQRDHRGLDSLSNSLSEAVKTKDSLSILRATTAFDFFSTFHLNKEEAHLYRIFNERIPLPEQAAIISAMSKKVPPSRFPEMVKWLFPLIGIDDRENMIKIFKQALPQPGFDIAVKLVKEAIVGDWEELTKRIPELKQITSG